MLNSSGYGIDHWSPSERGRRTIADGPERLIRCCAASPRCCAVQPAGAGEAAAAAVGPATAVIHVNEYWRRKRGGGGAGGRVPRSRKISGGRPPRNYARYFSIFFVDTIPYFAFSNIFEIKWSNSEEKLNFGDRWVWVPINPSPPNKTWWRRPCERVRTGLDFFLGTSTIDNS